MIHIRQLDRLTCSRCGGYMATSEYEGCSYSSCLITSDPVAAIADIAAVANPRHLSKSNEHFTPLNVVEAARHTMDAIDLDPATTKNANEKRVMAQSFYTKDDDGLSKSWGGRIFLNPPGGRAVGNKSSQKIWWQKLIEEWSRLGGVSQAIFVSFSIELFQTSQADRIGQLPLEFPFCIPSRRIAYDKEFDDGYKTGESPPHASAIIYLPESIGAVKRFERAFENIGHVCVPRNWA